MADLNPMVPGDVPYPQYSVTTTEEIFTGTTGFDKGAIVTKNATGELIHDGGSDLSKGFFQLKATAENNPSLAGDKIQVLGPRTRMILRDLVGGLVVGEDVLNVGNTDQVVTGSKAAANYIGKIFEIYTKNTDSTKKKVTDPGDRVIVETVQA